MILYLNILLALLTIPLLILPLGKLRDKRVKVYLGFTNSGILFYVCMLLATSASIYKEYLNNQEGSELQSNVTTIKNTQTKDSKKINDLVDKSDQRTVQSLEERERILNEFDKVSAKLSSITENEKQKLELGRPELIFKNPYFKIEDTITQVYLLSIPIINIGGRTAVDIDIKTLAFEHSNGNISNQFEMPPAILPETRVSPQEKGQEGKLIQYSINFKDSIKNYKSGLFLLIKSEYTDSFTGKKFVIIEYYTWRGFRKDELKFIGCSNKEYYLVQEYMKKVNVHI